MEETDLSSRPSDLAAPRGAQQQHSAGRIVLTAENTVWGSQSSRLRFGDNPWGKGI